MCSDTYGTGLVPNGGLWVPVTVSGHFCEMGSSDCSVSTRDQARTNCHSISYLSSEASTPCYVEIKPSLRWCNANQLLTTWCTHQHQRTTHQRSFSDGVSVGWSLICDFKLAANPTTQHQCKSMSMMNFTYGCGYHMTVV